MSSDNATLIIEAMHIAADKVEETRNWFIDKKYNDITNFTVICALQAYFDHLYVQARDTLSGEASEEDLDRVTEFVEQSINKACKQ